MLCVTARVFHIQNNKKNGKCNCHVNHFKLNAIFTTELKAEKPSPHLSGFAMRESNMEKTGISKSARKILEGVT